MNTFFDKLAASTFLEGRISEGGRNEAEEDILPLGNVQARSFEIFAVREPPSYRLKENGSDAPEEITFRVRGILCQKHLPPVFSVKNASSLGYLRQTVQLVSFLPDSLFGNYIQKIEDFTQLFRASTGGRVHAPALQKYEGYPTLVISNPYFSSRSQTSSMESLPLGSTVDPSGFLTRNQPQNFHHTMDNEVVYLSEHQEEGQVRFRVLRPDQFDNGDIVEAQFSFVAFPIAKNKQEFQLRMCLRALIQIDTSFRQASMTVNVNHPQSTIPVFTLKRKVTYTYKTDDEMDGAGPSTQSKRRVCIEE